MGDTGNENRYTCNEYRTEMILLSLQQRINRPGITEAEKQRLENEIETVKREMGMA